MALLGWFLFGGSVGYLLERWRIALILSIGFIGLVLIIGSPPVQLADGKWQHIVANIIGIWVGMYFGKRDTHS